MYRRQFILQLSGLTLSIFALPSFRPVMREKMDRIGMGTVLFRYRFRQTKPKELHRIEKELTLVEVPEYYRDRFGIRNLEFWSNHFESLETHYLEDLRKKIKAAGSKLANVQVDSAYDLASLDDAGRLQSVEHVKRWIDAVSFLGSTCIRVNPGNKRGSIDKSIESLREVNRYARTKNLVVLTENHFGLEMDPDVHLRIVRESGPGNIYTDPDFGNYPGETRFEALEKIMPYAYLISAKASDFNENMEHVSYDFDKCVRLAEQYGFKGIYSVEQWSGKFQDIDYEKVGDWLIDHVKSNLE